MPYNTRRGGSRVSPHPRSPTSTSNPFTRRSREDLTDEESESSEDEETTRPSAVKRKRKAKTPAVSPTIQNYHELGLEWGQVRAERILARQPHIKTRVSRTTLLEAQALQFQYNLDKTMLCIAEEISRPTLDAALFEGPLAREPNKYTNYQAYSLVSTTTPMPPKGRSEGFKERNKIVGNTWSSYEDDQQHIFKPEIFERLISEVMKETQYNPMNTSDPTEEIEPSTNLVLTPEEKEKYIPIFKDLVNMKTVKHDFKHGRLCRHSGNARQLEKVGIEEINKVVEQLNLIHTKFRFHFHLLVAAWNPNTTMTRALYQDEFTSAENWAGLARSEFHLLERFALASTQAPAAAKKSTKKTIQYSTPQAILRKELITRLNGLIQAHLPGGRESRNDTHPQGSNPQETLPRRTFRSDICLAILRLPGSRVTDEMLSKGCGAGKLPGDKVQLWIEDIVAGNYLVVKATDPRLNTNTNSEQSSTAT